MLLRSCHVSMVDRKSTTGFGPFDTTDGKPVPPQCTVDTYWIAGLLAFLSFKRDTNVVHQCVLLKDCYCYRGH
eukprot:m.59430 g.59430  ORF g.59430 m.59430 type:complete len:73 (-) comp15698_c0_seq1:128-346(-)